jgi:8-hydroxy-5-deazaflavin:NADPH oxidoreductase
MDIGVLGTGGVGRTLAGGLVRAGHRVRLGSRAAGNPKAIEWVMESGVDASEGNFSGAARFGEVIFNCTAGSVSLQALRQAGAENLRGKLLIDVANPLDFSQGMPPSFTVCNTDSLGEQIQREFPEARVVKALNTVNSDVMVNPRLLDGEHQLFLCGNDRDAVAAAMELLSRAFGWRRSELIDLGDISAARATEMYVALWVRLMTTLGSPHFSMRLVGQAAMAATPQPVAAPVSR